MTGAKTGRLMVLTLAGALLAGGPAAGAGFGPGGVVVATLVAPVDGTNEAPFLIVTVQDAAGALTDAPVFVAVLLKEAPER